MVTETVKIVTRPKNPFTEDDAKAGLKVEIDRARLDPYVGRMTAIDGEYVRYVLPNGNTATAHWSKVRIVGQGDQVGVDKVVKADAPKARMDLIPPELLVALGSTMAVGATALGRGDRNWEEGTKWGRYYASAMRHLNAWWGGEDCDPDTGLPHLWHAACCISFLVTYEMRDIGRDDRSPLSNIDHWSHLLEEAGRLQAKAVERISPKK
jgi:hypothetical protein